MPSRSAVTGMQIVGVPGAHEAGKAGGGKVVLIHQGLRWINGTETKAAVDVALH